VVSSIPWSLDKRRVSGVAVTRHPLFVVPSIQVCKIDVDRKIDDPAVTVEFPSQGVVDHTAPAFRELLLNRLFPLNDRHNVGVVVRLEQRETLAVVEAVI